MALASCHHDPYKTISPKRDLTKDHSFDSSQWTYSGLKGDFKIVPGPIWQFQAHQSGLWIYYNVYLNRTPDTISTNFVIQGDSIKIQFYYVGDSQVSSFTQSQLKGFGRKI